MKSEWERVAGEIEKIVPGVKEGKPVIECLDLILDELKRLKALSGEVME